MTCVRRALRIASTVLMIAAPPLVPLARGQFVDDFNGSSIKTDPQGSAGWAFRTGDGTATMTFRQGGEGYASIRVDGTTDRRGIWWALIKHKVSEHMDLEQLSRPEMELRIETRIRVSHAPRRVNLHLNTQRTTDFHSHLMEFDIPDSDTWHTISMTTRDFPAVPGDTVFAQMALIDWGLEKYQVDVDYFKADIVDVTRAGPDKGAARPLSSANSRSEDVPACCTSGAGCRHRSRQPGRQSEQLVRAGRRREEARFSRSTARST